jgi:hypothetical protein
MALLGQKMDELTQVVRDMSNKQDRLHETLEGRMRQMEIEGTARETRLTLMRDDVKGQAEDIENLKNTNRIWSGFNSAAAVVAGLVGWFKS